MDELKFDSILRTGDYTTDVAKEKTETNFIASTTFSAGNIFPVAFFQNLKRKVIFHVSNFYFSLVTLTLYYDLGKSRWFYKI